MQSKKDYTKSYNADLPVSQSHHTGLWGFARYMGCLNLSKCRFKTKKAAELARGREASESYEIYNAYNNA